MDNRPALCAIAFAVSSPACQDAARSPTLLADPTVLSLFAPAAGRSVPAAMALSMAFLAAAPVATRAPGRPRAACRSTFTAPPPAAAPAALPTGRWAALPTMSADVPPPALASLPLYPFIDPDTGMIPYPDPSAKTGVYAIYGPDDNVLYLGKSRDIHNTLRMHLGRRPADCVAYRSLPLPRPSRTAFDTILAAWAAEVGGTPRGNDGGDEQARWEKPIDVRWSGSGVSLTAAEQEALDDCTLAADAAKVLKKVCRRVQGEVEAVLKARGSKEPMKWAPKLKEKGLLDVGSIKLEIPETL